MKNLSAKVISVCLAAVLAVGGTTTALAADRVSDTAGQTGVEAAPFISMTEQDSQRPELPEGEMPEGQLPELPGEGMSEDQRPELPEGEMPEGQRPGLPGEGMSEDQRPELPEGEMPEGQRQESPETGEQALQQGGQSLPEQVREILEQLLHMIYNLYGGQPFAGGRITDTGTRFQPGQPQESRSQDTVPAEQEERPGMSAAGEGQGYEIRQLSEQDFRVEQQTARQGDQSGQQGGQDSQQEGQPGQQEGQPGMPGGDTAPTSYQAAASLTSDSEGQTYVSSNQSENAVLVDGRTVSIQGATVQKTGDTSDESADFYGTNAAVLADNGASLSISDADITTNGTHANGVFSYGTGTSVTISDSTITTSGNNSGGLMTTGGASLTASNLTVITSGNSSAAIRSDRGGGTVSVTEGSYSASGMGSPAIYSTADITVSDATLTASASEAVVIEGGNSVTLNNAVVSGNNSKLNGQSTVKTNVLIYQSMSGDASEGSSEFTMNGGSMTAETGTMFHVTNATTTINLSGVDFTYAKDSDSFLILSADAWGTVGKNGGNATVNLDSQTIQGAITVDSVSSLTLNVGDSSNYTGAINATGTSGSVSVNLESGSTWTLTGDSYVSSLSGDTSGIDLNGYTLYVGGEKASL